MSSALVLSLPATGAGAGLMIELSLIDYYPCQPSARSHRSQPCSRYPSRRCRLLGGSLYRLQCHAMPCHADSPPPPLPVCPFGHKPHPVVQDRARSGEDMPLPATDRHESCPHPRRAANHTPCCPHSVTASPAH